MKNNTKVSDVSGFNKVLNVIKRALPQRMQVENIEQGVTFATFSKSFVPLAHWHIEYLAH